MRKNKSVLRLSLLFLSVLITTGLILSCSGLDKKAESTDKPAQKTEDKKQEVKKEEPKQEAKKEIKQSEVKSKNPKVTNGDIVIKQIDSLEELPYGMWVNSSYNDYLIKNKKIKVIISSLDKKFENQLSGGNIIDVANIEDPLDQMGQVSLKYGKNVPPSFQYTDIQIKTDGYPNDGAAIVVTGKDTTRDVLIKTEYIIESESQYLRIVTTIENKTDAPLADFVCADSVNFGALGTFIEAKGAPNPDQEITAESNWAGAQRDNFSIGFTQRVDKVKSVCRQNTADIAYRQATIAPGQKLEFERFMVVSDKSLSAISDFVYDLKKIPCGYLSGKVVVPESKEGIGGIDVQVSVLELEGKQIPQAPFTRTYSSEKGIIGSFSVKVPAGKYFIRTRPFARQTPKMSMTITVQPGHTHALELQVSPENKIKFKVVDAESKQPIPCKLTFQSIPPTDPIDLGFPKSIKARNTYYSATGEEEIPMHTGNYRVIVSRGMEYENFEGDFTFGFGKENKIEAELKKVLDTKGWVSMDMGVKTNATSSCPVDAKTRLTQAVSEGLDVVVSADVNRATDLEPVLKQLGFDKWLKTIIGQRIFFADREHYGEFTVFPVQKENISTMVAQDEYKGKSYKDIFSDIRKKFPGALLMANRTIFPMVGYFTSNGYKSDTQIRRGSLPEIPLDFDLYELWEGKKGGSKAVTESFQLYFNMLMLGYKPAITASTYSDFTFGEEIGYPRVYVMSSTDDPSQINQAEIIDNLKKGKTLVTNGPFIKFSANGAQAGDIITDKDGEIECTLEVFAPLWVDISYIDINKDGIFSKRIFQGPSEKVQRYPRENSSNTREFKITTKRDVILNISVGGKRSLDPVVTPLFYGEGGGIVPFATTGPIFVDFDGNGKYDPPKQEEEVGN